MKRLWDKTELHDQWTLLPDELAVLNEVRTASNKLGLALLLKYFQNEGQFPARKKDIPVVVVEFIANQLDLAVREFRDFPWQSRTIERHRSRIRQFLGFRKATRQDARDIQALLIAQVLPHQQQVEALKVAVIQYCKGHQIEPPARSRLDRIVRSAAQAYEENFCDHIMAQLSEPTCAALDALLDLPPDEEHIEGESKRSAWHWLKTDPGRPGLETVLDELAKLARLEAVALPENLFNAIPAKTLEGYRQRIAVEDLNEIRRHPKPVHYTLMAAFCWVRRQQLIDNLVDIVLDIVHRIGVRAENKVDVKLLKDLKRIRGKDRLLYELSAVSLEHPNGIIQEVVYPVVNELTLEAIVKEYKADGSYTQQVHTVMRGSYGHYYRRMLPAILKQLHFHSNNQVYRPVLDALALLQKYADSDQHFYADEDNVPLAGVVPDAWLDLISHETKTGEVRINRIAYEMCVLESLRDKLKRRVIWVEGAYRFRNPAADLPQDFTAQQALYYEELGQPLDPDVFIERDKQELREALNLLNDAMRTNPKVKFSQRKGKSWIAVSPIEPKPEPINLTALKEEVNKRWGWIQLLDMLKETDLRIDFTALFKSVTAHENLDRDTLQRRLLLCLYALGTNTGIKRISVGEHGESYRDLLYVRKRFITRDNLRAAIAHLVNATLRVRQTNIWGNATSACASDSKKFGAWDQNLLTEWHIRYRGPGIMVYWHVEKKSMCVYSQVKSCSSSEVAAMIEGVLHHCTEMNIEKNYVDSHGQSEIAFAFCALLGFALLPRLKGIGNQKLYLPELNDAASYPNLSPVLATRAINWEIIRQEYDEMIKYATALRLGTADAESILQRFTRGGLQHPTYQALSEYGKVRKTIFLCHYLASEALRREIHEGLNVIENWNSANSFIFYGKGAEITTNRRDDQEIALLALHLLQVALVYINTLMIQQVFTDPRWFERMKPDDLSALTPLFYLHVTPYGVFRLDMAERLVIETPLAA